MTKQHQANVQRILTAEQRKEIDEKKEDWKDKKDKDDKDWKEDRKDWKDDKKDWKHKGYDDDNNMGRGRDDDNERRDDLKKLNLTEEQGVKIKAVNEEFRNKIQAIQKNSALTNDQKKEQREVAQAQHTAAIKAILTQEQRDKLAALKNTRPDRKMKK